jgi:hypothetical protein
MPVFAHQKVWRASSIDRVTSTYIPSKSLSIKCTVTMVVGAVKNEFLRVAFCTVVSDHDSNQTGRVS